MIKETNKEMNQTDQQNGTPETTPKNQHTATKAGETPKVEATAGTVDRTEDTTTTDPTKVGVTADTTAQNQTTPHNQAPATALTDPTCLPKDSQEPMTPYQDTADTMTNPKTRRTGELTEETKMNNETAAAEAL